MNKTRQEVREYIKAQPWYSNFEKNVYEDVIKQERAHAPVDRDFQLRVLNGDRGLGTLFTAFCWEKSPEGEKYWTRIEDEFEDWYFSK